MKDLFCCSQQNCVDPYKSLKMGVRQKTSFANINYHPQDKPYTIKLLTDLSTLSTAVNL